MASTTDQPTAVRRLGIPAALALADLASIMDELHMVLRCCERLIGVLGSDAGSADVVVEAVWTTAVLSYNRCFAAGARGMELTEADVGATPLRGEVLAWHKVLRQMGTHYTSGSGNPRERFEVGAVRDADGRVSGIAITSVGRPPLDDRTVRQTGALAYELSRMVDRRMTEHQERLLVTAGAMSSADLDKLPLVDLVVPD